MRSIPCAASRPYERSTRDIRREQAGRLAGRQVRVHGNGVEDVEVSKSTPWRRGGSQDNGRPRLRKICFRSRGTVCFPCASHEPRVAILAKAGCRRGCSVHGSLPMPILIPFGHPPACLSSTLRAPPPRLLPFPLALSRSRSIPTPRPGVAIAIARKFSTKDTLDAIARLDHSRCIPQLCERAIDARESNATRSRVPVPSVSFTQRHR